MYKLLERGGGEVIWAMPERKHSFLHEVFPKGGLPSRKVTKLCPLPPPSIYLRFATVGKMRVINTIFFFQGEIHQYFMLNDHFLEINSDFSCYFPPGISTIIQGSLPLFRPNAPPPLNNVNKAICIATWSNAEP